MTQNRSLAVVVLIETNDRRLFPENIDVSTAARTVELRRAVITNLPSLTRVVGVMSEETCRVMFEAHEAAMAAILELGGIPRPPADYVPPEGGA